MKCEIETKPKGFKRARIKKISSTNHVRCSDGTTVARTYMERMIHKSKKAVLDSQVEEIGYNVCTICHRNDCIPVTCMHLVSVDECLKSGKAELSWDPKNIVPAGMGCHAIYDNRVIGGRKQ